MLFLWMAGRKMKTGSHIGFTEPLGVTAVPGTNWYAKRVTDVAKPEGAEMEDIPEMSILLG